MVMDICMVTVMDMKIKIIDIHNHILYDVDDGSKDLETSIKMLDMCKKQDINKIILTPHVNSSVSKKSREEHKKTFSILENIAFQKGITLYLGSEIYISEKLPNLDFSKFTMGRKNYLLLEFSVYNPSPIADIIHAFKVRGYKTIIAHIERYNYLDIDDYNEFKSMGALFQINSSSIENNRKNKYYKKTIKLLKMGYVDFVASDCHNLDSRPQNLRFAYDKAIRIVGIDETKKIFYENQVKYLDL